MNTFSWRSVNSSTPCAICGKRDWCGRSLDGAARCMRIGDPPTGWRVVKRHADGGTVFRRAADTHHRTTPAQSPPHPHHTRRSKTYPTLNAAITAAARGIGGGARHVATYTYAHAGGDAGGAALHVCRFNLADGSKQFRPVHHNGTGFVLGDPPAPPLLPLYRLNELHDASTVHICEGEKAADAARAIGLIATTSAHGCKSAAKTDWTPLRGKDIVILPDHDAPGEQYAATVAAILHRLDPSCTLRIVRLPGLPEGGDIVEWIEARDSIETEAIRAGIEQLAQQTPLWEAPAPPLTPLTPLPAQPVLVRMSEVKSEPVRWLWPGRIALGKLTMIAGDPGLGKSFLTLDMAARLSTGTPWPDAPSAPDAQVEDHLPGGVVLLSAEDDIADTIRPRLDAAGADVARIIALQAVQSQDQADGVTTTRMLNLATDLQALEQAIDKCDGCRLVVVDPITAYLGKTDSHKNADMRGLLAPLSELASRRGIAIVAVSHLNKSGAGPAMYRTMGSLAFVAAARAAWAVVRDPQDHARRLLLPVKNNLATDIGGLAYTLSDAALGGMPSVLWDAKPVTITADDALATSCDDAEGRSQREEAADWLRQALATGPMTAVDVKQQAQINGIAERTLSRAKVDLGVRAKREGFGADATWYWILPSHLHTTIDCQILHRLPTQTLGSL